MPAGRSPHPLDPWLDELAAAVHKLVEQGPRARRAARARVRRTARKLLEAVDAAYPPPPVRRRMRKRRAATVADLCRAGWKIVERATTVAELRQAGATVRVVNHYSLAREWALDIHWYCNKTELREAVRSPRRRAEILGRLKLEGKIEG